MTLDDETAGRIAREVVDGGKATRVYPHSTDVALVRAGYAARDAEVEELRARLARVREWAESVALQPDPPADDEMAGQINAAGDVLAILSPTERETPADEWEYRARASDDSTLWFGVSVDRVAQLAEAGYEVQRRRVVGDWEVVPDDRA